MVNKELDKLDQMTREELMDLKKEISKKIEERKFASIECGRAMVDYKERKYRLMIRRNLNHRVGRKAHTNSCMVTCLNANDLLPEIEEIIADLQGLMDRIKESDLRQLEF